MKPGFAPLTRFVDVAGTETKPLELELSPLTAPTPGGNGKAPGVEPAPEAEGGGISAASWVMLGITGAAGISAGVVGGIALGKALFDDALAKVPTTSTEVDDARSSARTFALTADILTGVAAAAGVTTIVLFIVDATSGPSSAAATAPRTRSSPARLHRRRRDLLQLGPGSPDARSQPVRPAPPPSQNEGMEFRGARSGGEGAHSARGAARDGRDGDAGLRRLRPGPGFRLARRRSGRRPRVPGAAPRLLPRVARARRRRARLRRAPRRPRARRVWRWSGSSSRSSAWSSSSVRSCRCRGSEPAIAEKGAPAGAPCGARARERTARARPAEGLPRRRRLRVPRVAGDRARSDPPRRAPPWRRRARAGQTRRPAFLVSVDAKPKRPDPRLLDEDGAGHAAERVLVAVVRERPGRVHREVLVVPPIGDRHERAAARGHLRPS